MRTINTLPAPAGAGKTYALCQRIVDLVGRDEKVILVQPTKQLLDRTEDEICRLSGNGIAIRKIHGDRESAVVAKVTEHLRKPPQDGHVLLITWPAFERLPYIHDRKSWTLIIDEIPQVVQTTVLQVPKSHAHVTVHLDTSRFDQTFGRIVITDPTAMRAVAENPGGDAAYKAFVPLARTLISEHAESFVDETAFRNLIAGKRKTLTVHSVLGPSIVRGFKSVTIAGARFDETFLSHLWRKLGASFIEDRGLLASLRFAEHTNGSLVEIAYALEQPWSKFQRDKGIDWPGLIRQVESWMAGDAAIWMANTDQVRNPFPLQNVRRLPNASHGLNLFQDIHVVAILSALNPTPAQIAFYRSQGLDGATVRTAIAHHGYYQAVMRCSIRNPTDTNPKRIFVPDRMSAEWLRRVFPGSTVRQIGPVPAKVSGRAVGRPSKHESGTDRVRAFRERRQRTTEAIVDQIENPSQSIISPAEANALSNSCNETPISTNNNFVTDFRGSVFDRRDASSHCSLIERLPVDHFVEVLKRLHKRSVPSKDSDKLVSPARFDSTKSKTAKRGLDNVDFACGIWLDNDGGDLPPNEFADLFPTLRIVAMNTFSSTKARLRYRVYIPTSRGVTAAEYNTVAKALLEHVRRHGYADRPDPTHSAVKPHGFDVRKVNASDLFYLPSQPQDPSGRFFKDFKGNGRKPLVPEDWIRQTPVRSQHAQPYSAPTIVTPASRQAKVDDAAVAAALHQWRAVGTQPGNGDEGLFALALSLNNAGVDHRQIERMLHDEARGASSPDDRQRQVERIIKRVRAFLPRRRVA